MVYSCGSVRGREVRRGRSSSTRETRVALERIFGAGLETELRKLENGEGASPQRPFCTSDAERRDDIYSGQIYRSRRSINVNTIRGVASLGGEV